MKKFLVVAALLGGVSFSSVAAAKAPKANIMRKASIRSTHALKKLVVEGCGWVSEF
ncbi:hypothetical protein K3G63_16685 [Hymenobacter sp. HSC-4F20]|uniref:hypothetical protein n=1 Tax=Hymenobacter sp. HSC-4F20 TaxID=2864135 RepID=UPI001C73CECB|nr:hypothetical protein [Hymenobacter sp. HSC-4F20]MBX0292088.1 hypothetical protein [Hymenobacter sp. HSC-4F20]